MTHRILFFILLTISLLITSCENAPVLPDDYYDCSFNLPDPSANHPKNDQFQAIMDEMIDQGITGATMYIRTPEGAWSGVGGKADIVKDVNVEKCHKFFIASISKVFTATVIFALIEEGKLSLNDQVQDILTLPVLDKLANAKEARIRHLLNHTSGIPDHYTAAFDLENLNRDFNNLSQIEKLEAATPLSATNEIGETYYYSNCNYIILGFIAEAVSGQSLAELYDQYIFDPAGLESAYYGTDVRIPPSATVRGYLDPYDNGNLVDGEFLYKDELDTPDGGIAIHATDLGRFFEALGQGQLLQQTAMDSMQNWFDIPSAWQWGDSTLSHTGNGYGLEYFSTVGGKAIGHTGGIAGFSSTALYFPATGHTFVIVINVTTDSLSGFKSAGTRKALKLMFE